MRCRFTSTKDEAAYVDQGFIYYVRNSTVGRIQVLHKISTAAAAAVLVLTTAAAEQQSNYIIIIISAVTTCT
jgi:hypothetical protein